MKYKPTKFKLSTSHYDKDKADYVCNFISCLSHTKGKWAGQKFSLLKWQEQIVRDIFGIVKKDGNRQFNTAYIEIPKKCGKQLDLNTPIPTPFGFTTMGQIKVGDTVFDEKGNKCKVIAKSSVDFDENAYLITFKDGEKIKAGARHMWVGSNGEIKQTEELFKSFDNFKILCFVDFNGKSTDKYFRYIDKIEPIKNEGMQCIEVDSPSHQYLVGRSFLPTHNSELAAAVALYLLFGDGEPSAEVYGAAADRGQASIVFDVAHQMTKMCPALLNRSKILTANKRIINKENNGFYQVLSAEVGTKHGLNVSGLVLDEVHAQPNRKLYDVLTKGSGDAREQPLYFLITTAGTDTNSICYELHQKALDIMEGRKIDPTFYPVIYGADQDDDWTDPKVWKKANPSLGVTISMEKVRQACENAKENPAEENTFRQLRLNQWVKQAIRWMPMDKWDKCAFRVNEDELKGRICYGGLDLSSTTDMTSFVLVFPPKDESDKYVILPYFWVPDETLDLRVKRDHVPYDVWKKQGYLMTTEGNVVHYGFIERFIEELGIKFNIREIAFDRWGAVQMVQNLENMGFCVVPFGQGFKDMSPPTKELMKLTLEERIAHGGHPVLRWNMDNIFVRSDPAGNIKADKEKSTEKIDGAIATIMALDRAVRNQSSGESVYDTRGILVI